MLEGDIFLEVHTEYEYDTACISYATYSAYNDKRLKLYSVTKFY